MRGKQLSIKEKESVVRRVAELSAQGVSREKACKEVGVAISTFETWRRKGIGQGEVPAISFTKLKAERKTYTKKETKLAAIIGTPAAIGEFLRSYQ